MVFAAGTRQRRAEFAVTKRAAKRRDSANDPKHEQREPGLYVRQLKAKAGEDAGADDVGNNDGRCRDEPDSPPRSSRLHGTRFSNRSHLWIDNPEIIGTGEFFRCTLEIHNWPAPAGRLRDVPVAYRKFVVAWNESRITSPDFPELSEAIPSISLKAA